MPEQVDAIVIGAGHNGLVAAAYLARAGQAVLVLERRQVIGGAAATEEIFPGYQVNTGADDAGLFSKKIATELELVRHGLNFLRGTIVASAPQPTGQPLLLFQDPRRSAESIAEFSAADAEAYPGYVRLLTSYANILKDVWVRTPPELAAGLTPGDLLSWLRPALRIRQLGRYEMMAFLGFLPLTASEFLNGWFESARLKGLLGTSGVKGLPLGPMASGTAYNLLYQSAGEAITGFRASEFVEGGLGNLSAAICRAARIYRVEVRTGMPVTKILIHKNRVSGVELADGEQIKAPLVLSNLDPRTTLFGLVGADKLPMRIVRRVRNIRFRGATAKLALGLTRLPAFRGELEREALQGHIVICPDLMHLERAADHAKYGEISTSPALDVLIPSLLDPGVAPPGRHLMTVQMQYAPYQIRNGNWEDHREALTHKIVNILAAYAPELPELIEHQKLYTPLDYELVYGLPEGSGAHGMMSLDQQLFMRPFPGYAQYQSPVENLYLCGAGTHPGGGVTGLPGFNAAHQILQHWQ